MFPRNIFSSGISTAAAPVQTLDEVQLAKIRQMVENANKKKGGTVCVNPPQVSLSTSDQPFNVNSQG